MKVITYIKINDGYKVQRVIDLCRLNGAKVNPILKKIEMSYNLTVDEAVTYCDRFIIDN